MNGLLLLSQMPEFEDLLGALSKCSSLLFGPEWMNRNISTRCQKTFRNRSTLLIEERPSVLTKHDIL